MRKQKVYCYNCKKEGFNVGFIPYNAVNGMTAYFCCEDCLNYMINNHINKFNCYYLMVEIMIKSPKSTQTYIKNELGKYTEDELQVIKNYLMEQKTHLIDFLSTKDFKTKTMMAKYLFKILEGVVEGDKDVKRLQETQWEEIKKQVANEEFVPIKTTKRKNKGIGKWLVGEE